MKVLLAGASGAIGMPLTRQLVAHDHEVLGIVRDPSGAGKLAALGATPVVADALDELLRLARTSRAGERRTFDLAGLVGEHVRDWQARFRRVHRSVEVRAEGTVPVHATPGAVGQIVDVLLSNALEHGDGRVALYVRSRADRGCRAGIRRGWRDRPRRRTAAVRTHPPQDRPRHRLPLARQLAEADLGSLDLVTHRPPVFRLRLPTPDAAPDDA